MKKRTLLIISVLLYLFCVIFAQTAKSQNIGINPTGATPNASAALDVDFTNKGLLIPRVALTSTASAAPITAPATSLIVYNTATAGAGATAVIPGYYHWTGSAWALVLTSSNTNNIWSRTSPNVFLTTSTDMVGLGTNTPSEKLDVSNGNIGMSLGYYIKSTDPVWGFNIIGSNGANDIEIGDFSGNSTMTKLFVPPGPGKVKVEGSGMSTYFTNTGIGVNNSTPSAALDINGTFKLTDGTQGIGKVLTSDASGNATWQSPGSAGSTVWALVGNAGTTAGTNFLGTIDAQDLVFKTTNTEKMRILAAGNVGIGTSTPSQQLEITGSFRLPATTSTSGIIYSGANRFIHRYGSDNFFAGVDAGNFSATGSGRNVGIGSGVLSNSTTGCCNVGIGYRSLFTNTTGFSNIGIGYASLGLNTSGTGNTAVGINALFSNTTGSSNVAYGYDAAYKNTVGIWNTAIGFEALYQNISGVTNTAIGHQAMYGNTAGGYNIGIGDQALASNTTGSQNISIGFLSGVTATNANANITGNYNIFMGYYAGPGTTTQLNNAIAIGKNAIVNTSNTMILGGTGADIINVGIGTSNPSARLEVAGQVKITGGTPGAGKVLISDAVGLASWQVLAGAGAAWGIIGNAATNPTTDFVGTTDAIDFVTRTNNVERIRVTSTGRVGIGTNAPARILHVRDGSGASGNGALVQIGAQVAGADPKLIYFGDGTFCSIGENVSDDQMELRANRFYFNVGNVGIGTTVPSEKLEVCGNLKVVGTITAQGAITTNGAITCSSDKRFKKDIVPLNNSLNKLLQLQGTSYYWRINEFPEKNFTSNEQIGFIAQDIEKIFPQLVHTDDKGFKSVDYSRLTPILVEAIKEQQKIIETQSNDMQALKAEVSQIKELLKANNSIAKSEK